MEKEDRVKLISFLPGYGGKKLVINLFAAALLTPDRRFQASTYAPSGRQD
jgi:hypothetical protein